MVVASAFAAAPAVADVYKPTRKDDPVPGNCKPRDCSLREAFLTANATPASDTIVLGKGTYRMQLAPDIGSGQDGRWWTFGSTVRGQGPGKTTIDAKGIDAVMHLGNFLENNTLEGLRITGGNGNGLEAGGISGAGRRITLKNVVVAGNSSTEGSGGGARFQPGTAMKIINSKFLNNDAASGGGGIYMADGSAGEGIKATIRRSSFRGNSAHFGGGIYSAISVLNIQQSTIASNEATEGGGLDMVSELQSRPTSRIAATTISDNSASKGGGMLVDGNQPGLGLMKPIVSLVNSTVAGNRTLQEGGGIMADNAAEVTLNNVTVARNLSDSDENGGGVGGGVFQHSGAIFALGDSVIAANTMGTTRSQCAGSFLGHVSLLVQQQAAADCPMPGGSTVVLNAKLGLLGDFGGPTQTIPLRKGSPGLRRSDECPARDQRGKRRPAANCDSGAFERP